MVGEVVPVGPATGVGVGVDETIGEEVELGLALVTGVGEVTSEGIGVISIPDAVGLGLIFTISIGVDVKIGNGVIVGIMLNNIAHKVGQVVNEVRKM
jgi:hypothetical protein